MKRLSCLFALVACVAIAGTADYPKPVKKKLWAKNDLRGKPAPKLFVQQWLNGDAPETKGKVLVVDFWATWCGPCRELIPEMNAWHKKFGKDVVFVGISDEKVATVQGFMKDSPMQYHVAVDASKTMSKVLGVEGIPHVMIVSPDGIVRWQGFPGSDEDKLTEAVIQQILDASKK